MIEALEGKLSKKSQELKDLSDVKDNLKFKISSLENQMGNMREKYESEVAKLKEDNDSHKEKIRSLNETSLTQRLRI